MKKYLSLFIAVASLLQADCDDHTHKRNAWLMPVGRVIVTPPLGENSAVSFLAEGGNRDARGSITAGTQFEFGRLKVTGEYLTQRLTYHFTPGKSHKWVRQGAVGGHYQHLLDCYFFKAIDVKGWYSYAPSLSVSSKRCGNALYQRHIAGSNAYSVSGGLTMTPFCEDLLTVDIGYDSVRYRRKFHHDKHVKGIGGSVAYTIRLQECVDLNLKAEFRRPYNYYQVKFNWHKDANWNVGLFAAYTAGKYHLPRSATAGIEFSYLFDNCGCTQRECCPPLWSPCDIYTWVQAPAVYMPEVLAIAEERLLCSGTVTSSAIPAQSLDITLLGDSFNAGQFFSSDNPLVFTAVGLPTGISIDSATGVVSVTGDANTGVFTVVITGSNECGSSSQPVVLTLTASA